MVSVADLATSVVGCSGDSFSGYGCGHWQANWRRTLYKSMVRHQLQTPFLLVSRWSRSASDWRL